MSLFLFILTLCHNFSLFQFLNYDNNLQKKEFYSTREGVQ